MPSGSAASTAIRSARIASVISDSPACCSVLPNGSTARSSWRTQSSIIRQSISQTRIDRYSPATVRLRSSRSHAAPDAARLQPCNAAGGEASAAGRINAGGLAQMGEDQVAVVAAGHQAVLDGGLRVQLFQQEHAYDDDEQGHGETCQTGGLPIGVVVTIE